ncbi:helix-turn-helix domain-containing protein [Desulfurobacterium crinifex]
MIGKRLKKVRKTLGITQRNFAKEIGISEATLRRYENEQFLPDAEVLQRLAKKFGINIHWLITGEGSMFVNPDLKEIPPEKAGIDKELAVMISMLTPEQQEGLKQLFRGYQKMLTSRLSASSSERQRETANLSNSHDENVVE